MDYGPCGEYWYNITNYKMYAIYINLQERRSLVMMTLKICTRE